ncbi:hypothetical protein ODE01S_13010 [Oceanithermus desulfurans NBRC 100063]|uniref:Uncharacterized protein n=1 Tax=Oceanithermus desulfurans NBRC 100063 TaxID=1227550 RepID=A0A511RLD2_9DEIN|nr:hypothetical protein ODE01S_13010 [Oceanithermus desulfurans NBRC 100063]
MNSARAARRVLLRAVVGLGANREASPAGKAADRALHPCIGAARSSFLNSNRALGDFVPVATYAGGVAAQEAMAASPLWICGEYALI